MDLFLKPEWQRIGISISGGADSALLSYLILSNTSAEIHFVNQIRCWKTRPWQEHVANTVLNWFEQKFDHQIKIHRNFIPPDLEWADKGPNIIDEYGKLKSGNQICLRSHNEYIIHKEKLDAWYAAVNKNPDIDFDGALEDRNEGHIPPHMKHMDVDICHPFVYTMKDWIIQQYYDHDILDLLELTRSCEGEFEGIDYKTYTPGDIVPECGECFWCKEREWALAKVKQ